MKSNVQRKVNMSRDERILQAINLENEYELMGMPDFASVVRKARRRIELAKVQNNIVFLDEERKKRR